MIGTQKRVEKETDILLEHVETLEEVDGLSAEWRSVWIGIGIALLTDVRLNFDNL